MKKERIDILCVQKGLFESRNQAQRAIMAGIVRDENDYIDKIVKYVKEKNMRNQYTFSIGLGSNISDTYLALKYAKSNGFKGKCILLVRNNNNKVEFKVL